MFNEKHTFLTIKNRSVSNILYISITVNGKWDITLNLLIKGKENVAQQKVIQNTLIFNVVFSSISQMIRLPSNQLNIHKCNLTMVYKHFDAKVIS